MPSNFDHLVADLAALMQRRQASRKPALAKALQSKDFEGELAKAQKAMGRLRASAMPRPSVEERIAALRARVLAGVKNGTVTAVQAARFEAKLHKVPGR